MRNLLLSRVAVVAPLEGVVERGVIDVLRALQQVGPDRQRQIRVELVRHRPVPLLRPDHNLPKTDYIIRRSR